MHRRAAGHLAVLLLLAGGLTACSSDGPSDTLDTFLAGWRGGDLSKVGFVTADGTRIAATDVQTQLAELAGDLAKAPLTLTRAGDTKEAGETAAAQVKLDWTLPGGAPWSYQSTVRLTDRDSKGWQVIWEPSVVQPDLTVGDQLRVRRQRAARAGILDGAGKPLVTPRPVVTVGITPEKVENLATLSKKLDEQFRKLGVEVDFARVKTRVENAEPRDFVDLVTLRRPDYDKIRSVVRPLPGTDFIEGTRDLAPSRAFGRALLGLVDVATKEDIDTSAGRIAEGDQTGQGGLQERYDKVLAGQAGAAVVIAQQAPDDQVKDTEVFTVKPVAGTPVKTTLDVAVQNAADQAVAGEKQPSALVAVRISDSAVLAAANGPDGGTVNTAFTGKVPPGSTFKMVTAVGLLQKQAVTADTPVDCPKTKAVEGATFKNSHDMELGKVPFRTDFAKSCNTAFVNLAPKLGADGLRAAATAVGLGGAWDLGTDAFTGQVSDGAGAAELAAASFGQGTTAVSPLAMASATAAVARGKFEQPKLVLDPAPANPAPAGAALDGTAVTALHTMMREVVTAGTGTGLRNVPGKPVYGKTGTAEFETGSAETHAWFVGWQGDVAFAVMVEKGGAGSEAAIPIAERFLRALPR